MQNESYEGISRDFLQGKMRIIVANTAMQPEKLADLIKTLFAIAIEKASFDL